MKIYIDFNNFQITKKDSDVMFQGDVLSNAFELLFYNYSDTSWFPTMSQLAPNGRQAGDFAADPLEPGESQTVTIDGVTYLKYKFTIGPGWCLVKGKSNFFIWKNTATTPMTRKCIGRVMVTLNESTETYFIDDVEFNPAVKAYINSCVAEIGDGSPKVFDTEANIEAMHDDEGIAVATDTGYIYVWNDTQQEYVNTGMKYAFDGSPSLFETTTQIQNETTNKGLAVATDTGYIWVWNATEQEYQNTNYKFIADVSNYYTKTESDSTFAPKSNAVTHTGNQLQDYSGNDIYPNLDDGQIIEAKLATALKLKVIKDYVTPEMFGAKGDGITDDTTAIQNALNSTLPILLSKTYLLKNTVSCNKNNIVIFGNGKIILNNLDANEFTLELSGNNMSISGVSFEIPIYESLNNSGARNGIKIYNCKNVIIENCNFSAINTRINGFLDFYTNWENVKITNCNFNVNTTFNGETHIGGLWFRSRDNITCKDLFIEKCNFASVSLDEVVAVWGDTVDLITNVIIDNCLITASGMQHCITFGGVNDCIVSNCIVNVNINASIIHASADTAISKNVKIIDCIFNSTSTSSLYFSQNKIEVYNCYISGVTMGGNEIDYFNTTIILTDNKMSHYDCTYKGCTLDVKVTGNQLFRRNVKLTDCTLKFEGNGIFQLLNNNGVAIMKNCIIELVNGSTMITGAAKKFVFVNNIFTAGTFSTYFFTATDVIAFNIFANNQGTPSNAPIGWSTNLVG